MQCSAYTDSKQSQAVAYSYSFAAMVSGGRIMTK